MKTQNQNIYKRAKASFYKGRYKETIAIIKNAQINAEFKDLSGKTSELQELLEKATRNFVELNYNKALRYAYEKRYSKVKALVDEVKKFDLSPEQKKLFDIQDIIDKSEKIIEDIYNEALNFFNSKDYIGTIYTLEEIAKTNVKSKELLKKATQALVEVFYSEILEYKNKKNYYKVAELLAKSKQFNFNKEQEKIFDTFIRDVNNILETESRELYNKANDCYNKNDLQNAFRYINDSHNLLNNEYNEQFLEQILQLEQKIVEAEAKLKAEDYFDKALAILEYKEQGKLEEARDYINNAIELNCENPDCMAIKTIIEFLIDNNIDLSLIDIVPQNGGYAIVTNIESVQSSYIEETSTEFKTIILETATKKELLTIDGFDEEKVKRFIQERKNGKKYYDLNTFAIDYELQPHQMIMLEDKLIFSQKPVNKIGRKVDF